MRSVLVVAVLGLGCATSQPAVVTATPTAPVPEVKPLRPHPPPTLRLPTSVRPVSEALSLTLVPSEPTFSGTATIALHFEAPADHFWLHGRDLTIAHAAFEAAHTERPVFVSRAGDDLLEVQLDVPFGPGDAQLTLAYRAPIDAQRSRGLYRVDEGGEPYLYTFFEPVDARRAFPCFDEPGFKIPWTLSLTIPAGHQAFANAAAVSSVDAGNARRTVTFAPTRPLPSYLVAFVEGPFEVVAGEPAGHEKLALQFIVPRGRGSELRFAKSVLPRIVTVLEEQTGVPYPYGKLDVAVVPRFWGTMEHPGLVALGQPLMLMTPEQESLRRRTSAVNIATHELAHYWFGDLVTNAWWDDTWLNESLGQWMDLKASDAVDPSLHITHEALDRRAAALDADAMPTARGLRQPVESLTDIESSFDGALTYDKGATVLAMFEKYVGRELFRKGITHYLTTFTDRNATADDLFRQLDEGTGQPIAAALRTFVTQPGAPLITATATCAKGKVTVALHQERFFAQQSPLGGDAVGEKHQHVSPELWQVPVCVRAVVGKKTERACTLLTTRDAELPLAGTACPDLLVVNDGGLGYFRVSFDGAQRKALLAHLDALDAFELASLASDVAALTERGDVPVKDALLLGEKLVSHQDVNVALAGLGLIGLVDAQRLTPELKKAFAARLQKLVGARARALGWKERQTDSGDDRRLRPGLVGMVAWWGEDAQLRSAAATGARGWLEHPESLDEDLAGSVLRNAARQGDALLFERLVTLARTTTNQHLKQRAVGAIASFTETTLAERARVMLLEKDLDLRDWLWVLYGQLGAMETRPAAYAFLTEHFEQLTSRMRDDEAGGLIATFGVFCEAADHARVEQQFASRVAKIDGGPFQLKQALERIDQCVAVEARVRPGITAWLTGR
jgi:aminopeptidase N